MRGAACVFIALLVAASLGCADGARGAFLSRSSSSSAASGAFATASELAWLRKLGEWWTFSGAHPTSLLRTGGCAESLQARVGHPPTSRLVTGYRLYLNSCALLDERRLAASLYAASKARELVVIGELQKLPDASGSHVDPLAGRAASQIVGRSVQARCWSPSDWAQLNREHAAVDDASVTGDAAFGRVTAVGAPAIQLSPRICQWLKRVEQHSVTVKEIQRSEVRNGPILGLADATAVKVVAHEAEHARGVQNEAVTECYAIEEVPATAVRLGSTAAVGREMAQLLWDIYPRGEPHGYSTPRCKRGTGLDLHLATTVWP